MKTKPFVIIFLFSCAAASMCLTSPAEAVTLADTAKLVPPETILLFDIDDFSLLETQFKKTNLYKFYKEPAMAGFFEHVKSEWKEENQELQQDLERIFSEIDTLPRGRVAFAIAFDEQNVDPNEPLIMIISQWGQAIENMKVTMDKLVETKTERGSRKKTDDYRGVAITTLVTDKSLEDFNYCILDDCLLISSRLDFLKFSIAHIQGASSPTLADDNDYNAAVRAIGSHGEKTAGQIDLFLNFKQIIKLASGEDTSGEVKTIIDKLGLDNVTSLSCSINFAAGEGGNSSAKAILKIDGPKKGICKMLELQSEPLRTPKFISDSICSISYINVDIKKAFEELGQILNSFSPQYGALMYMPLLPPSPQGEPGVQLKTDVVDHFGSQIIIAQNVEKSSNITAPGSTDVLPVPQVKSLFALAITNRNALEKSLSAVHSKIIAPINPDSQRQLLGHTLYLLDPSSLMPGFGGPMTPMHINTTTKTALGAPVPESLKMAITVTDTHLLFAEESVVERAIRSLGGSQSRSIGSVEWFRKVKSSIPSTVGLAGLEDSAAMAEYFWTTLRQMSNAFKGMANSQPGRESFSLVTVQDETPSRCTLGRSGGYSGMKLPEMSDDAFDFTLLPEFDAVRKYFGLSGMYGLSVPEGFFFEIKYLKPE